MEERKKYPHDPQKYLHLIQFSKDSLRESDSDSLELLRTQARSLQTEGYVTIPEKEAVVRIVTLFLKILAHPINH